MAKILLIEDELNFGSILTDYLSANEHEVRWEKDGEAGWRAFEEGTFDLCVVDVMLPRKDGFEIARDIRAHSPSQPLIFLTARAERQDILKGFRSGADDYITKPFDPEELLLRIQALLKRVRGATESTPPSYTLNDFTFEPELRILRSEHGEHRLSPREADLFLLLVQRRGALLSRDEALEKLWGDSNYFNARSMDVFVSKLRKYVRPDPRIRIENIHGKGFRLVVEE